MKEMTARELLAALRALPDLALDLPIITEGCDCVGDVGSIDARDDGVILNRTHAG